MDAQHEVDRWADHRVGGEMSKETKMTAAWAARVYSLSRKSATEAVRLATLLGVTTAEGFLRLREHRRWCIVELARLRGGTHLLKEAHIALEAGLDRLTGEKPSEYWNEARDLFIDAETALKTYLNLMGFDHTGNTPEWLREAENGVALGFKPPNKHKPCRPGACACDMSYQDA